MKIKKLMAGTLAMIMVLSLSYNAGGPIKVHAQENEETVVMEAVDENVSSQEGIIDFSSIKAIQICRLQTIRLRVLIAWKRLVQKIIL